jgi:EmrB/QacA subfamily drug resistance transporter
MAEATAVRFGTPEGRWILLATVLGSGIAGLDATVVNVALPTIGRHFHAGVSGLQWVITGYLITLASLILIGGSLGDRYGRRRVFRIGVVWFTAASLLCGVAPSVGVLIAARALQGVGGALLTPGSLAIIEASFRPEDRGRAIGAWSGLGGVATAVGPFVGGWLVSAVSWRVIFLLNLPLAATVLLASRHVPESSDPTVSGKLDIPGAGLGMIGLAAATYALIEGRGGAKPAVIVIATVLGVGGLVGFVLVERMSRDPMLPIDIFASRQFTVANLVTVAMYAALGGVFFLLAVDLQQVLRYRPVSAGAALFPVTVILLLLSSRAGALAQRVGPRLPMTLGPATVAVALLLMRGIGPGAHYVPDILPAIIVFGAGLALTVAPLTTTVLAAADPRHAGVASGVNNAVARVASLLAVAVLPAVSGLTGDDFRRPAAFSSGFHTAVTICAGLCLIAGAIALAGIRNNEVFAPSTAAPSRADGTPVSPAETRPAATEPAVATVASHVCCPVDGPPVRRALS